ncbi:MAG: ABC transporter ATP-binding protein [Betaproteobacteria bacterium RIFCSPLOWO2_12_FULL_65_14]|nr:MAG: ABC transporter ATP-binding protein [Betaproteobacteria bacterium RIFCSPLOWO2_12_FULL_65_14]
MSEIILEKVTKQFGRVKAVDDVSFRAEAGKFVVLLGPSGCGKSTVLRLIAGLEEPTQGRILIDGRDVTKLAPEKRKVSMVFQSYALFPHLSVAENIVFGLKVRRLPAQKRKQRLAKVVDLVGLTEQLDRKPWQLSGGQRQRVALARAIVAENSICLMDEPLSNLDAQLRHGMRVEIRALQQRLGMTVVYVTHDQVEAMSMADRIVLIREGRIEQEGSPEELYARPATMFAARFIGTPAMNLVALADGASGAVIRGSADALLPGPGAGLTLGVRPEHVRLEEDEAGPGVHATVTSAEYHGADTIVTVQVGGETLFVRAPGQLALAAGAKVRLAWDPEAAHLFDSETGLRAVDVRQQARVAAAQHRKTG